MCRSTPPLSPVLAQNTLVQTSISDSDVVKHSEAEERFQRCPTRNPLSQYSGLISRQISIYRDMGARIVAAFARKTGAAGEIEAVPGIGDRTAIVAVGEVEGEALLLGVMLMGSAAHEGAAVTDGAPPVVRKRGQGLRDGVCLDLQTEAARLVRAIGCEGRRPCSPGVKFVLAEGDVPDLAAASAAAIAFDGATNTGVGTANPKRLANALHISGALVVEEAGDMPLARTSVSAGSATGRTAYWAPGRGGRRGDLDERSWVKGEMRKSFDHQTNTDTMRRGGRGPGIRGGVRRPAARGELHTHQPHTSTTIEVSADRHRALVNSTPVDTTVPISQYRGEDLETARAMEAAEFSYMLGDEGDWVNPPLLPASERDEEDDDGIRMAPPQSTEVPPGHFERWANSVFIRDYREETLDEMLRSEGRGAERFYRSCARCKTAGPLFRCSR
ncbi:hypothetical protein C8F04DRAFT_1193676 [Mycena alexandri]|uniref:Uncharacterized protein n=1 Tax=Mycena alexandri TaxID=1745969 RepID=A0AAD6SAN6_9AGAR|nr:hypothetical protein C8F04DRAFT_1193676 [Mycena alexandri]